MMEKLIALFEYIAASGCCSSENTPFTIDDFMNYKDDE